MSVLVVSPGRNPEAWVKALKNEHPGMNIYVYPEDHDKEEVEYAISWKHPRGIFKNYPNLKVIASMGAGVDHITSDPDIPENIKITRVVDEQLTEDMSAFVLALIMDKMRNISHYYSQKNWEPTSYRSIENTKIGIMGLGVLGKGVANTLKKVGFNVYGWSKSTKDIDGIHTFCGDENLTEFLSNAEILVCLLPLTPETENILNKELFEKLPKGAHVINVARGEHLVEQDLLEMIDSEQLCGASLDVFRKEPLPLEHPFWNHSKIKITPHIASVTNPKKVVPQMADNYERMSQEQDLLNVVERKKGY